MPSKLTPERSELLPDSAEDDLREEIARADAKAESLSRANAELGGVAHVTGANAHHVGHDLAQATYRQVDPALRLEETLEEANARVVDLAMENAVLCDRKARQSIQRRVVWLRVLAAVIVLGAAAMAILFTSALGMTLWVLLMGGLGAVISVLAGRIKPNTDAPKQSPYTGAGR